MLRALFAAKAKAQGGVSMPPAPMVPEVESPAEDASEPANAEVQEKHDFHAKMARKAGSPAARAVHAKLKAHFKNKLK